MSKHKFRRHDRVIVVDKSAFCADRLATVLNPVADQWGYITARLDSQHPHERGLTFREDQLEVYTGSDNQFHHRKYTVSGLSHAEIEAIQIALSSATRVNFEAVQSALAKLPNLP